MTRYRIEQAEELCAKATPEPWAYGTRDDDSIWMSCGNPRMGRHSQFDYEGFEDDARFATQSRTLLPEALAEIRRLRAALEAVRGFVESELECRKDSFLPADSDSEDGCYVREAQQAFTEIDEALGVAP